AREALRLDDPKRRKRLPLLLPAAKPGGGARRADRVLRFFGAFGGSRDPFPKSPGAPESRKVAKGSRVTLRQPARLQPLAPERGREVAFLYRNGERCVARVGEGGAFGR